MILATSSERWNGDLALTRVTMEEVQNGGKRIAV